jgi:hypothetical protein
MYSPCCFPRKRVAWERQGVNEIADGVREAIDNDPQYAGFRRRAHGRLKEILRPTKPNDANSNEILPFVVENCPDLLKDLQDVIGQIFDDFNVFKIPTNFPQPPEFGETPGPYE